MSTPAVSTTRADGASYAVTMTSGDPWPFASRIRGAVTGTCVWLFMTPPPRVQGHSAPGAKRERNGRPAWSHPRPPAAPAVNLGPPLSGLGATEDRGADEVVPAAVDTHLDDVTGELVDGALEPR